MVQFLVAMCDDIWGRGDAKLLFVCIGKVIRKLKKAFGMLEMQSGASKQFHATFGIYAR